MKRVLQTLLLPVVIFTFIGCAQQHQSAQEKYPRKSVTSPERRAGPAMLFYEEAEKNADLNKVVVTPPSEKKPGNAGKSER